MALVFSGGTLVDNTINLGTTAKKKALFDGVIAALGTAGWTTTATNLPIQTLTVDNTANASNNETVVCLGKTYTFKTAINNSNDGEVLVGVDGATSFANLQAAINLGAGSGTLYASATTAGSGTITAVSLGGTASDTLTYTANSSASAGASGMTETLANGSWGASTMGPATTEVESAETPDYLTIRIRFGYAGESTQALWYTLNRDNTDTEQMFDSDQFVYTDNADHRIIAHKYGFYCFKTGSKSDFTTFGANVFSIPEPMRAKKVTAATNASPIAITTNVPHGWVTGQSVKILYVEGNLAANGTHVITVTGPSTLTLNGSTGTGTFSGTRGMAANITSGYREIFEFASGWSAVQSGGGHQFRDTLSMVGETPGFFNGTGYPNTTQWQAHTIVRVYEDNATWPWFNDASQMDAPVWAISEDNGLSWKQAGQIYNFAVLRQQLPMDQPITDESGNNWLSLTDNDADGTFMVLVS
jgi:hypothetical protein